MQTATLLMIFNIVTALFITIVALWVLWAIIRGAVLSALRKHAEEERQRHPASLGDARGMQ